MKYKKFFHKQGGFLLLESLLTLIVLMAVIIFLTPLTVNWLSKHREAKCLVEESRQLYESSLILNKHQPKSQGHEVYTVEIDKNRIWIKETRIEVVIYESVFEK